jgi:carboxyl-terminal processing protease
MSHQPSAGDPPPGTPPQGTPTPQPQGTPPEQGWVPPGQAWDPSRHGWSPVGQSAASSSGGGPSRPGRGVGGLVLVAVLLAAVFLGGLVIGQGGLAGAAPATPVAQQPTPGPGQPTPATGETAQPLSPSPGQNPIPTETLVPIPTPGPINTAPPDMPADFAVFWEAYQTIRENYVGRDQLGNVPLTYGAIRGMVEALGDTGHSIFLTPEELRREQESLQGTIVGIGVLLGERNGRPVVISVVSGGPASRVGMRSGDEMVAVDGQNVERLAPEQLAPLVRGEQGTPVEIRVYRAVTDEFIDFTIVREEIRFPAASWTMVPGTQIALLRFVQFSQRSAAELQAARDEAVAQGAQGLVLDLRSNPGGLVHEAVDAASLFLPEGETIYLRELADGSRIPVTTNEAVEPTDLPMVVLIDGGSASSAEIMSGGIQAAGRAQLVGQTTFGTGTVLITYTLSDGSAVRIAIERWLTPDGELIFGRGIEPDVAVELDPQVVPLEPEEVRQLDPAQIDQMGDAQLLRAIELLREAGIR